MLCCRAVGPLQWLWTRHLSTYRCQLKILLVLQEVEETKFGLLYQPTAALYARRSRCQRRVIGQVLLTEGSLSCVNVSALRWARESRRPDTLCFARLTPSSGPTVVWRRALECLHRVGVGHAAADAEARSAPIIARRGGSAKGARAALQWPPYTQTPQLKI